VGKLSIAAAIAHVEMKTKQDQEELGTQIIVEGSKFVPKKWRYCPKDFICGQKICFQYSCSS
jgi:hypothetical protein